jgi:hypothetical protein
MSILTSKTNYVAGDVVTAKIMNDTVETAIEAYNKSSTATTTSNNALSTANSAVNTVNSTATTLRADFKEFKEDVDDIVKETVNEVIVGSTMKTVTQTHSVGQIIRIKDRQSVIDAVEYHMPSTQLFSTDDETQPISLQVVKDISVKVTGSNLFNINAYIPTETPSSYVISGNRITITTTNNTTIGSFKLQGYYGSKISTRSYFYLVHPETNTILGHKKVTITWPDSGITKLKFGRGGNMQDMLGVYYNETFVKGQTYTISCDLIENSVNKIIIENVMVSLGDKEDAYEPYRGKTITQPPLVTESTNLFNPNTVTTGLLNPDGSIDTTNTSYRVSDFIPVKPNTPYRMITYTYTTSVVRGVKFYDEDKNVILQNAFDMVLTTSPQTITTTENVFFIRMPIYNSKLSYTGLTEFGGTYALELYGNKTRFGCGLNLQICDSYIKQTNEMVLRCAYLYDMDKGKIDHRTTYSNDTTCVFDIYFYSGGDPLY